MSKIALSPNASGTGTFTVASPNSNTNRTLTLPDADGALLTADGDGSGLTSLTAGNLTGTLPAIDGSALTGIDTSPPTTFDAVGTYGLFRYTVNNGNIYAGSTYAGSSLVAAGATTGLSNIGTTLKTGTNGGTVSGTWRAMGTHDPNGDYALTVYVRIS